MPLYRVTNPTKGDFVLYDTRGRTQRIPAGESRGKLFLDGVTIKRARKSGYTVAEEDFVADMASVRPAAPQPRVEPKTETVSTETRSLADIPRSERAKKMIERYRNGEIEYAEFVSGAKILLGASAPSGVPKKAKLVELLEKIED